MADRPKLTLGKLILETARGNVKERRLTQEEARDIHDQLNRIGFEVREKVRARYWRWPLRFIEPLSESDPCGPHIRDANGDIVAKLFWPCHPAGATEQAEQETYEIGRAMAAVLEAGSPDPTGDVGG